jgi:glycerol uptake facilitator-like aquaporin
MRQPLAKRVVAEALGTFFLLAAVVGSGIMAERLAISRVVKRTERTNFIGS